MNTRLITAGAILVLAIVFGFIFWNQFSSNQKQLAGGTPPNTSNNYPVVPKNDSVGAVQTDLNSADINGIDSDSSQFSTQLNGF